MKKLSLEPYKGTRDFYPEDQFVQNYIFSVMRKVVESYGYLEYGASILEETELYKAKSGEEIINEQTYSFKDRGEREVTIRPEMTPTVARMIAQKRRELVFPVRWYSIPNLFRYERPQRGRLREHWQLNVDMFGVDSVDADVEIISVADSIMKAFGASPENYEIRINSRKLMNQVISEHFKLSAEQSHSISKLIDRMAKMPKGEFLQKAEELIGEKAAELIEILFVKTLDELGEKIPHGQGAKDLQEAMVKLEALGMKNVIFDPSLMRGFDYYTGIVFEVFDISPINNRSLFGGGRYDDLVGIFDVEKVTGVGFGMGDVTIRDYLETYNLLPKYKPSTELYIVPFDESFIDYSNELANYLRTENIVSVAVDITNRQVSKKVKTADREKIPFVMVIGEEEVKTGKFKVKSLVDGFEVETNREGIIDVVQNPF